MTEDELVVRGKTDREAFGLLYNRYYPEVARYCLRRLFDRTIAEDVTADIFLSVASSFRDFRGRTDKDFRCWLFRIASNAVHAYLRQTRRRRELLEAAARERSVNRGEQAHRSSPACEALNWPQVYQALLELDERDQAIVMLRFFSGCAHDEIAAVVGGSAVAVRTALSRTLARLRAKFNPSSPSGEACVSSKD
jgi:RNA polymerase sigma-70 factor (ECF subfamily)